MYLELTDVPETVAEGVTVTPWPAYPATGVIVTIVTPEYRDRRMIHVGAEWRPIGPIQLRRATEGRLEVIETTQV